ncbi:MAG: aspartate/glutamate racemase family protein [Alphaproteobacteria bacterium]|jgi:glutamate racemase|nr:aspartate/glutamate racemase family protein [Alphaproteobacteria bacterium]
MIGVFDSGHGGLTIFRALTVRFPQHSWMYYGDHANAPYGSRPGGEVVALTQTAVAKLFMAGCKLVILGCNTATAVAGKQLQTAWLPQVNAQRPGHRVLGIIAPTVEAVTQTPWHVKEPVFPQKYNTDTVALFATQVTVNSGVYEAEIAKRCPQVQVLKLACPKLVPLIEAGAPQAELAHAVQEYVQALLATTPKAPEWAILGCTHYPLVAHHFRAALPPSTRLLDQPLAVANALEDYFTRHPEVGGGSHAGLVQYFTSGDTVEVSRVAELFLDTPVRFGRL